MFRAVVVVLILPLAAGGAFAQSPAADDPFRKPAAGNFRPPSINWVQPEKEQPRPQPPRPVDNDDGASNGEGEGSDEGAVPAGLAEGAPLFELPYIPEVGRVAMALPVDAPGLVGRAAVAFHQGCRRGVEKERARLWIDLYPAADAAGELAAYESALANDAPFIIGPMSKSGARAVVARHPDAPVPTLLLQPPPPPLAGGGNYFIMTLDSAREAAALARFLFAAGAERAAVVAAASALGQRQAAAFAAAWLKASGDYPRQFSARALPEDERADLRAMFEEFKKQTESESELADAPPPPAVFIAGDAGFARRARSYLPARYPAYAGSVARAAADGPAALQLEGLRFLEIPWLARPAEADFGAGDIRAPAERRFFALGADACRAALRAEQWSAVGDGWTFRGAAGDYVLRGNEFLRQGALTEYRDGRAAAVEEAP